MMNSLQDQQSNYSFSFHGGAGVIPQGAIDTGIYQAALSDILVGAQSFAEENLENPMIKAVDLAEHCVKLLEDHSLFNAGKGSVFTANGTHEMEASVMDGSTLECGAVSLIKHYQNPISIARLVMEKSTHVYLVGEGAEDFAAEHGLPRVQNNNYFSTKKRFEQLQAAKNTQGVFLDHNLLEKNLISTTDTAETSASLDTNVTDSSETGTVGCVAYYKGDVAAATSTGGMTNKRSGRVGDTPIIGAGTYANNDTCAVSCTGKGEMFMRSVAAYDISARMKYGAFTLKKAVHDAVHCGTSSTTVAPAQVAARSEESPAQQKLLLPPGSGGVISVDGKGCVVMDFNSQGMFRGWAGSYSRSALEESGFNTEKMSVHGESVVVGQVGIWSELVDVDLSQSVVSK